MTATQRLAEILRRVVYHCECDAIQDDEVLELWIVGLIYGDDVRLTLGLVREFLGEQEGKHGDS